MDVFRPVPIDVIQLNEKSAVDLFIKHEDRFMPFLCRDGIFTKDQLVELNRFGIDRVYIRLTDANAFEEYIHAQSETILTDPTVPPRSRRRPSTSRPYMP